jgi:F-type H+-transporting ATPase subunit alpha
VRGNEPELLKEIAGGEWSDDVQNKLNSALEQFAEDFGFDLDEEGHPLEEGEEEQRREEKPQEGEGQEQPSAEEKEEEAVPA